MDGFHTVPTRRHPKNQTLSRSSSLPNVAHGSGISSVLNNTNAYNVLEHSPPSPTTTNKKKRKRKSKLSTVSTPEQQVPQLIEPEPAPSTKVSSSASSSSTAAQNMFSFWDYLRDEVTVSDFDTTQEVKRERITNFLGVPTAVEKLMIFGFVVCLDSFLYTFTILPLRFGLAFYHYILHINTNIKKLLRGEMSGFARLRPSQKCDFLKGLLVMITCVIMWSLDPSRIYHSIRGQAVLKLYVVFNVLEVFDKLCCSVGGDILDALFSKSTLGDPEHGIGGAAYAKRQLRPITFFLLATGYMVLHTTVLFYQMITLNVATNFYSNMLLSLLISNQFVEIKQSVFKKFEKENLFQLSCSDIVERFQQLAFLLIITLRNVIELSDSSPSSVMPSTFVPLIKLPAASTLNALMTPVLMVIASELAVDWLKHAFITKFNQIRPSIYGKYIDVLCKDLVVGSPGRLAGPRHAFIDQSPVVSRRIGFPSLPLACLVIRMVQPILPTIFMGHGDPMNENTMTVASAISGGLMSYLTDHQGILSKIIPARIQFILLSMVRCGWLEQGLDKGFRMVAHVIIWSVIAICLLALKVLVGTNLLGYAYRRYAGMTERDTAEAEKDQQMKEMNKDEEQYKKHLREYLDDPADSLMGLKPVKYTLENVDRFSMVRSRIP